MAHQASPRVEIGSDGSIKIFRVARFAVVELPDATLPLPLPQDKAQPLHRAAQQSVGSLSGAVAESLVRDLMCLHCR